MIAITIIIFHLRGQEIICSYVKFSWRLHDTWPHNLRKCLLEFILSVTTQYSTVNMPCPNSRGPSIFQASILFSILSNYINLPRLIVLSITQASLISLPKTDPVDRGCTVVLKKKVARVWPLTKPGSCSSH